MPRYHARGGNRGRGGQGRGFRQWQDDHRRRDGRDPDGRGLYRSRNGRFLGVCKGLADYFGLSLFWVRTFTVLLILFTGLWPGLALYFIAALVMRLEPVIAPSSGAEREFYDSYSRSRSDAVSRIRDKFERLERRLRRMEDRVTSKEWQWERRMRE